MAFRMQASVPELMDISQESAATLEMYGATPGDGSFASNCLTARRLAERGVRFIQLYHRDWDHHGDLVKYMHMCCGATDRATWALINDLKQRGLFEDTLIIWGGEFGRTPMFQGKGGPGRDHHMKGFSMWLAGGGIKGGTSHGATDELGYNSVDNVVHVRDLHATILHLLGIDHMRFSVKHQGLDMRLTGVEPARVVSEILA
jgi:arylsulfatase A-like enzyme